MILNPPVDLAALHTAILVDLATAFPTTAPGVGQPDWTIAFYLRQPDRFPVPALLLELTGWEPAQGGANIGTSQASVTLRFQAYVITDYKTPNYRVQTRLYAALLTTFLSDHTWKGNAGAIGLGTTRFTGAYEDYFRPDAGGAQYDCMRVEWEQDVLMGPDSWAGGVVPTSIFVGIAPKIGPAHIADYVEFQTPS